MREVVRGDVVIITGSQDWTDEVAIERRLRKYPKGTILIHGDARGADTIAARVGRKMGFQVLAIPYFGDLKSAGGHARNELLVEQGMLFRKFKYRVTVEAFPLPQSRGTWDCVEQARAVALQVFTGERN